MTVSSSTGHHGAYTRTRAGVWLQGYAWDNTYDSVACRQCCSAAPRLGGALSALQKIFKPQQTAGEATQSPIWRAQAAAASERRAKEAAQATAASKRSSKEAAGGSRGAQKAVEETQMKVKRGSTAKGGWHTNSVKNLDKG